MQDDSPQPQEYGSAGKVAIPRLQREPEPPPRERERDAKDNRVGRACLNCRRRKVKCSGGTPRCANCTTNNLDCVYEQARKDRLREAQLKTHTLVQLLKDLSLRADEDDKKRIEEALHDVNDGFAASTSVTSANANALGKRQRNDSPDQDHAGEAHVSASVGSNDDLDLLDEDLLASRESRETGFVGQNSEVQWLRSLQRQIDQAEGEPYDLPYGPPGSSKQAVDDRSNAFRERRKGKKGAPSRPVADSTFYLDNDSLELDLIVDPHEIPDPVMLTQLYECYTRTIHTSFPIVPHSFNDQFYKYVESVRQERPFQVPDKWLAILNLILAIGARYSHLINADWQEDERDHILYMTRAVRLLGLKDTVLILSAPDLPVIQATGLLSLYYLVIGHVSRAWITIGISIRLALAVGLHLRNEDPKTPATKKETLGRTWWSLHSIECILSSITGRPCVLAHEDCTIPLPQTHPSEQFLYPNVSSRGGSRKRTEYSTPSQASPASSSATSATPTSPPSSYLDAHIKIALITQQTLSRLYAPRTAAQSWEYMQKSMRGLVKKLEDWASTAVSEETIPLNFDHDPELQRQRLLLQVYYCSTKILITRPCVCRIERRIRDESDQSAKFNQNMAQECVEAAKQLAKLFPDHVDTDFVYTSGPWWSIVHNIMQAVAILLLELSYQNTHMPTNDENILFSVKKLIRWLRAAGEHDSVSRRAYRVVYNILRSCGPPFQDLVKEILAHDHNDPSQPSPSSSASGGPASMRYWSPPFSTNLSNPNVPSFPPQFISQLPMQSDFGFQDPFVTNSEQDVAMLLSLQDLWSIPEPALVDDHGLVFQSPEEQPQGPPSTEA